MQEIRARISEMPERCKRLTNNGGDLSRASCGSIEQKLKHLRGYFGVLG
jgi:hypothetical protein